MPGPAPNPLVLPVPETPVPPLLVPVVVPFPVPLPDLLLLLPPNPNQESAELLLFVDPFELEDEEPLPIVDLLKLVFVPVVPEFDETLPISVGLFEPVPLALDPVDP